MTDISLGTFSGCTNLSDISIGSNVIYIEEGAFSGTAYYDDENNWEDGVLYLDTYLLDVNIDEISGEYSIKKGTTVIANSAFKNCTGLTSVTIPDSVVSIGAKSFSGCTSLENVNMGNGVIYINSDWEGGAFEYCSSLTSIYIPKSVTTIESCAFLECTGLTDVYYAGSEDEWKEIEIIDNDGGNYYFCSATLHYNCSTVTYELGDINFDGVIDFLDAMMVLRADAELIELTDEQLSVADVNGDGAVDSLDAILILRYDARLIESF